MNKNHKAGQNTIRIINVPIFGLRIFIIYHLYKSICGIKDYPDSLLCRLEITAFVYPPRVKD